MTITAETTNAEIEQMIEEDAELGEDTGDLIYQAREAQLPEYLTTKQAGDLIGVDDAHVRRLLGQGKIAGEKFGHIWMIRREAIRGIVRRRNPRG